MNENFCNVEIETNEGKIHYRGGTETFSRNQHRVLIKCINIT